MKKSAAIAIALFEMLTCVLVLGLLTAFAMPVYHLIASIALGLVIGVAIGLHYGWLRGWVTFTPAGQKGEGND